MKDTDITPAMEAESARLWADIDLDNERRRLARLAAYRQPTRPKPEHLKEVA